MAFEGDRFSLSFVVSTIRKMSLVFVAIWYARRLCVKRHCARNDWFYVVLENDCRFRRR